MKLQFIQYFSWHGCLPFYRGFHILSTLSKYQSREAQGLYHQSLSFGGWEIVTTAFRF